MIPKATYLGVVLSVVTALVGIYRIYGQLRNEVCKSRSGTSMSEEVARDEVIACVQATAAAACLAASSLTADTAMDA